MDCIFCKIVSGEIPSKKVFENGEAMAFLDINPASRGHTLVVTKKHYSGMQDVREQDLDSVMRVVKHIAQQAKSRLGAEGVNIIQNNGRMAGQLVDHIHFHVIPRYTDDGIAIHFPRAHISEEEMKELQQKLKQEEKKQDYSRNIGPGW